MIVNYLNIDWDVENFLDFAKQVKKAHKDEFPNHWAVNLSQDQYEVKRALYDAIELKSLANFWRSLNGF